MRSEYFIMAIVEGVSGRSRHMVFGNEEIVEASLGSYERREVFAKNFKFFPRYANVRNQV
jgi:hypothetical protein